MTVQFEKTSYRLLPQFSNSVEICVKSTSKGTSEEFVIHAETNSTISEVLTISRFSNEIIYRADSTYLSQSPSRLYFVVDSENTTETQCYNISVDFQAEGICDLFGQSCGSVNLWTHLSKSNKTDPVSITRNSAQVVVEVPDQCKCSSPTQSDNETTRQTLTQSDRQSQNDIVITASVLSVVVAIAIAAVIMMIVLFYYRKTKVLVTKNNIDE